MKHETIAVRSFGRSFWVKTKLLNISQTSPID